MKTALTATIRLGILLRELALMVLVLGVTPSGYAAVSDDQHWDKQFGPVGVNATAYGLALVRNKLYVGGGSITAAGNTKVSAVAGFDGTNWFSPNAGLLNLPIVIGVGSDSNYLYVGGIFTNADDPKAINTARWDGTNWSSIGMQGAVYSFKRNGAYLYTGGVFTSAGGGPATNIARWDGTNWFALGSGVSGPGVSGVTCMAFNGNNVYAGGTFSAAGTMAVTNIAYYDGSLWHALGNPFNGAVTALYFYGPYLYAGGAFTNTSLGFTNLARWDGSIWSAVPGGGANGQVEDLTSDGTNLFVAGLFTQVGGIAANGIASFNGSAWSTLGAGVFGFLGVPGQVQKTLWSSNQLYVCGSFERAGNVGACNVARWDGSNWWDLGGQTSKGIPPQLNYTFSLLPVNGPSLLPLGLYVGGYGNEAGNVVVQGIGRWDGAKWNPVGTGISGSLVGSPSALPHPNVHALATDGANLYLAGNFTNAGGTAASAIASWDGNNWSALGSGVDWQVETLALDNANYLYVGGAFTNAGGAYSRGMAVWIYGSWNNLGNVEGSNGVGNVNSLVYDGGTRIFAGGVFTSAGGVPATNIAYFDNTSFTWNALGPGLNGQINGLAYGNGLLYASGLFTKAGALTVNRIAQWDGTNWAALGTGVTGGVQAIVNSVLVVGTNVYATGNFTNAGGVAATNIAVWNGSTWSALGSGIDPGRAGYILAASGNDLFVAGNFQVAGDAPAEFFCRWNSQSNFYAPANMLLTRTAWQTNRQFRFRLTGTSGQSYLIESSTNLRAWTPLLTNSAMFYDFTDVNAANFRSRFYRAVLGP